MNKEAPKNGGENDALGIFSQGIVKGFKIVLVSCLATLAFDSIAEKRLSVQSDDFLRIFFTLAALYVSAEFINTRLNKKQKNSSQKIGAPNA